MLLMGQHCNKNIWNYTFIWSIYLYIYILHIYLYIYIIYCIYIYIYYIYIYIYIYMYIPYLYIQVWRWAHFRTGVIPRWEMGPRVIAVSPARVWGNDAKDLTSEHWGYLGACAGVTFLSIRCPRGCWRAEAEMESRIFWTIAWDYMMSQRKCPILCSWLGFFWLFDPPELACGWISDPIHSMIWLESSARQSQNLSSSNTSIKNQSIFPSTQQSWTTPKTPSYRKDIQH